MWCRCRLVSGAHAAGRTGPLPDDLKPVEIVQPQGSSFDVRAGRFAGQRWRLRLGFTARDGPVGGGPRYPLTQMQAVTNVSLDER